MTKKAKKNAPPPKTWGGARPGAGRPRTREQLDAGECRMLAELLQNSLFAAEYADTADKLLRMAEQKEARK